MKKQNPFKQNKNEIKWNIINCLLIGAVTFIASMNTGYLLEGLSARALCISIANGIIAGALATVTKFQEYWTGQKAEYSAKVFSFIKV